MNRYPEVGEKVKVQASSLPAELQDYLIGEVIERNGEYIYIQLDHCQVVVERYPNEIEPEQVH